MPKTGALARLTSTRAATLPKGDHTDPATRGLQLRVVTSTQGIRRSWLFRYKWEGVTVRLLIGVFPDVSLAEARAEAEKYRALLGQNIDPRKARDRSRGAKRAALPAAVPAVPGQDNAVPGQDKQTVAYLIRIFTTKHLRPRRKRPEYAERFLNGEVLPQWGHRDPRTITPAEVIEFLDRIVDRGSPVMANRAAGILGQLFKFGIHRGMVTTSPVQLLYRPGGDEPSRDHVLSDDELTAFLLNLDAVMRSARTAAALRILLYTGQRRGELVGAAWHDIDLEARTWRIPPENSKTGTGHTVPLSAPAVADFTSLKRFASRSPYVLPREDGDGPADPMILTRSVARNRQRFEKVGVKPFVVHDLRRTLRTGLAGLKVAPHVAERVLNHAQDEIASIYDRYDYLEEKRAALDLWANHLAGLQLSARQEAGQ